MKYYKHLLHLFDAVVVVVTFVLEVGLHVSSQLFLSNRLAALLILSTDRDKKPKSPAFSSFFDYGASSSSLQRSRSRRRSTMRPPSKGRLRG